MTTRLVLFVAVSVAALAAALTLQMRGAVSATSSPHAALPVAAAVAEVAPPPVARGAQARAIRVAPQPTLPVDSPWALPPVLVLQSRTGGHANGALRRWVLRLDRLALSPVARR